MSETLAAASWSNEFLPLHGYRSNHRQASPMLEE